MRRWWWPRGSWRNRCCYLFASLVEAMQPLLQFTAVILRRFDALLRLLHEQVHLHRHCSARWGTPQADVSEADSSQRSYQPEHSEEPGGQRSQCPARGIKNKSEELPFLQCENNFAQLKSRLNKPQFHWSQFPWPSLSKMTKITTLLGSTWILWLTKGAQEHRFCRIKHHAKWLKDK